MIANEVRIGNWVLIPTNNEIKIPCFPKKIKAITLFGEFDFTEPTYPENHLVPAKHCSGIELSEETIVRLGFEKIKGIKCDGYRIKTPNGPNEFMIFKIDHLWHFGFNESQTFCYTHFNYVHQLQNLYFTLTGEELSLAAA